MKIFWKSSRARAAILENSNGYTSAKDHPLHSVFGFRVGFSESADRMAIYRVGPNLIGMWEKTKRDRGVIRLVTV